MKVLKYMFVTFIFFSLLTFCTKKEEKTGNPYPLWLENKTDEILYYKLDENGDFQDSVKYGYSVYLFDAVPGDTYTIYFKITYITGSNDTLLWNKTYKFGAPDYRVKIVVEGYKGNYSVYLDRL